MENAKNTDRCFANCICHDVRRPIDNQFTSAGNSANTTVR